MEKTLVCDRLSLQHMYEQYFHAALFVFLHLAK